MDAFNSLSVSRQATAHIQCPTFKLLIMTTCRIDIWLQRPYDPMNSTSAVVMRLQWRDGGKQLRHRGRIYFKNTAYNRCSAGTVQENLWLYGPQLDY
eukprot:scaffold425147_cov17-Prasinocladus_malaysianus.AAC.1